MPLKQCMRVLKWNNLVLFAMHQNQERFYLAYRLQDAKTVVCKGAIGSQFVSKKRINRSHRRLKDHSFEFASRGNFSRGVGP